MNKSEIQKMQDYYNEWITLLPELEKALTQWKKATELLTPLNEFYFSPQWQELHQNFNETLETEGNYSILSEDALWNAFHEHRRLAMEWLKLSTAVITKD